MFYKHLGNWVIYGELLDKYNEFFIADANSVDENFAHPDNIPLDVTKLDVSVNFVSFKINFKFVQVNRYILLIYCT